MIFVFEVHINDGYSAEQYAAAWVRASKLIQAADGARGTRLHRKIGSDNVLLAIAQWESVQQRNAMEADASEQVRRIIEQEARYVEVRIIGEFEDAEWQVLPTELE